MSQIQAKKVDKSLCQRWTPGRAYCALRRNGCSQEWARVIMVLIFAKSKQEYTEQVQCK